MQSGLFPHVLVYGMCCVSGFVVLIIWLLGHCSLGGQPCIDCTFGC